MVGRRWEFIAGVVLRVLGVDLVKHGDGDIAVRLAWKNLQCIDRREAVASKSALQCDDDGEKIWPLSDAFQEGLQSLLGDYQSLNLQHCTGFSIFSREMSLFSS